MSRSDAGSCRIRQKQSSANKRRFDFVRRNSHWWLLGGIALLGLIVIGISAWQASDQDRWVDSLWLEVARASVGVVAVGVLGGALSYLWKQVSDRRTKESERREKLRVELMSLVALYNDVKAVRRRLRSLGLDLRKGPDQTHRSAGRLTQDQAHGFHEEMRLLNELQLGFEAKARQFGQTNFLAEDTDKVVEHLGAVEEHLNNVLSLWEVEGWKVREGTSASLVYDGLQKLFRVRTEFGPNVSVRLHEITELVNLHIFGEEATASTKKALDGIGENHRRRESQSDDGTTNQS